MCLCYKSLFNLQCFFACLYGRVKSCKLIWKRNLEWTRWSIYGQFGWECYFYAWQCPTSYILDCEWLPSRDEHYSYGVASTQPRCQSDRACLGLAREMRKKITLRELKIALTEEWENIPQNRTKNLVYSMPNWVNAGMEARGGNTKY